MRNPDLSDSSGLGEYEKSRLSMEVLMLKLHCTSLMWFPSSLTYSRSGLSNSQTKP